MMIRILPYVDAYINEINLEVVKTTQFHAKPATYCTVHVNTNGTLQLTGDFDEVKTAGICSR